MHKSISNTLIIGMIALFTIVVAAYFVKVRQDKASDYPYPPGAYVDPETGCYNAQGDSNGGLLCSGAQ